MTDTDTAALVLRLVLGVVMLAHGCHHVFGGGRIDGTARWFAGIGFRRPLVNAWAGAATELAAGAGLVLGLLTPLAVAAAIGVMTVAGITVHRTNGFFVFREGYEYVLTVALTGLALGALGPGRFSLDRLLGIAVHGPLAMSLCAVVGVGGAGALLGAWWRPSGR